MIICKYSEDFKYKNSGVHFHMHTSAYPLHYHDYYEFFLVISGTSSQCICNKNFKLTKGDAFFLFPNNFHQVTSQNSSDYKLINLMITDIELKKICDIIDGSFYDNLTKIKDPIGISLGSHDISYFIDIIQDLQITNENRESYVIFVKLMWFNIIKLLYKNNIHINKNYPEWLNEFLIKIVQNNNFLRPVKELYKLSYFSHSHFDRMFKYYIGKSLKNYLLDIKMDYAASLLEHTDLSVIRIVEEVGYSSVSHFNYTFKQYFSVTPTEYKKKFTLKY